MNYPMRRHIPNMKLDNPIVMEDGSILEEVNPQEAGVYCIFRLPNVKRGMHGKTKGHVDELLIVGLPWSKANKWLKKYGIRIEKL